ncbi:MAG: DivIVA domain-containing protein [Oscillospiraceae bacterium]|nr:DivIVA domain-containing protein [Oscillospiraceae bacterium]
MFTPQEIQEKTFEKAVFGGYDMQTVDEFLEPLTEDYITLYRENAVLKSKMKVLVEKLEEYRAQEQSMRKAIVTAQRTADAMVAEAERKCAQLMNDAGSAAQDKSRDADEIVNRETERINNAKKTAKNFIEVLERDIRGHLELLEKLKTQDFTEEEIPAKEAPVVTRQKPFDYEQEEMPLVVSSAAQTQAEIADTIEQSITKIMDVEAPEDPVQEEIPTQTETPAEQPSGATDSTIKFTNLQFGRNYDPTTSD